MKSVNNLFETYDALNNKIYYTQEDIIKLLVENNVNYSTTLIPYIEDAVQRALNVIAKEVDNILTITKKYSPTNIYHLKNTNKEIRKRFRNNFNYDGKEYILYDAPYIKYNKRTKVLSVKITSPPIKNKLIAQFKNDENIRDNLIKCIYEVYNTNLLIELYNKYEYKKKEKIK